MQISKKALRVIDKYRDEEYLKQVPKYILTYDLQGIGIDIKPCYDADVMREIMSVIVKASGGTNEE